MFTYIKTVKRFTLTNIPIKYSVMNGYMYRQGSTVIIIISISHNQMEDPSPCTFPIYSITPKIMIAAINHSAFKWAWFKWYI